VNDLPQSHLFHSHRSVLAAVVHIHKGKFALFLPAVVGRKERILVFERSENEIVEIEQRRIVQHLVIAHEIVVLIAQHPESENHRHRSNLFFIRTANIILFLNSAPPATRLHPGRRDNRSGRATERIRKRRGGCGGDIR